MIVEFTGCSGAGKTVLREAVVQELHRRGHEVCCPLTALLGQRLSKIRTWPRLANLLLDLKIFPQFAIQRLFGTNYQHSAFQKHCQTAIATHSKGLSEQLRLLRSMTRKLALHDWLQSHQHSKRIILVDEGIIHLAQIIHGRTDSGGASLDLEQDELHSFSTLAPRPDLLVSVTAPLEILELRIRQRNTHQPLPGRTPDERSAFLRRADQIVNIVARHLKESSRVLLVENYQQNPECLNHHAKHVVDAIGRFTEAHPAEHALADQRSIYAA